MARDAVRRLYDVDDNSVVYKKPKQRGKYDHGTVTFRAKKGKLINLDKLHESVWGTRLSGGTRSGLVRLDVRVVGKIQFNENKLSIDVRGADARFLLIDESKSDAGQTAFQKLRDAVRRGDKIASMTGRVDGWAGRWPKVLKSKPSKPLRLVVTGFDTDKN